MCIYIMTWERKWGCLKCEGEPGKINDILEWKPLYEILSLIQCVYTNMEFKNNLHRKKNETAVSTATAVFNLQHFSSSLLEFFSGCSLTGPFCSWSRENPNGSLRVVLILRLVRSGCLWLPPLTSGARPDSSDKVPSFSTPRSHYQMWVRVPHAFSVCGRMCEACFLVLQLRLSGVSLFPWTVNIKIAVESPTHLLGWDRMPWRNSTWAFFFFQAEG